MRFCFAAVAIDVNAFEPETIISIVCSYVGSCMVERIERLQCHPGKSDGHVFGCPEFCYRL